MSYFKHTPLTNKELQNWKQNKNINPRTNRKIKTNSIIYKLIESYSKIKFTWKDLTDTEDPISLIDFWEMRNGKKFLSKDLTEKDLIIYQENNLIRGFHFETVLGLYQNNIIKHPVSGQLIPKEVFDQMKEICKNKKIITDKKEETENVKDLALRVFQLFNNMSIYLDNEAYYKLQSTKINILVHELKSFYNHNLTPQQKNNVNPTNKELFKKSDYETTRRQILLDMKLIIENASSNNKIMVCYLMLAGLIVVIPELKQQYPHLEFQF